MKTSARARYRGCRFPSEIIGHAVWLYFRFPLGLRMVEELLAARGIIVSHETVRQWARNLRPSGPPLCNPRPGRSAALWRQPSARRVWVTKIAYHGPPQTNWPEHAISLPDL